MWVSRCIVGTGRFPGPGSSRRAGLETPPEHELILISSGDQTVSGRAAAARRGDPHLDPHLHHDWERVSEGSARSISPTRPHGEGGRLPRATCTCKTGGEVQTRTNAGAKTSA